MSRGGYDNDDGLGRVIFSMYVSFPGLTDDLSSIGLGFRVKPGVWAYRCCFSL
jgi:hypothetical protein